MKFWMVRDREHYFEERRRGRGSTGSKVYTIDGGGFCKGFQKEIKFCRELLLCHGLARVLSESVSHLQKA